MINKEKVFCEHCIHRLIYDKKVLCMQGEKKLVENYFTSYTEYFTDCSDKNKHNDCIYFKKETFWNTFQNK